MVYADTGTIISVYVEETTSNEATRHLMAGVPALLTSLHRAEFANALALRQMRGQSTPGQAAAAEADFAADQLTGLYRHVTWPTSTWDLTIELSRRYSPKLGTRTLDVLHVALAMALRADLFITFDLRQRKLARAVGLRCRP